MSLIPYFASNIKQFRHLPQHPEGLEAVCNHDGRKFFESGLEAGIDDDVIVPARLTDLIGGPLDTTVDHILGIRRAALQTTAQLLHTGRQNKDIDTPLDLLLESARALAIDIKHQVNTVFSGLFDRSKCRSVQIPVNLGPFGKGIGINHALELFPRDEEIILAMHFAGAGCSSGITD